MDILKWLANFIGDSDEKKLKQLQTLITKINALEDSFRSLSDEELRQKTEEFKQRIAKGESEDNLLPDAFAVVREASARTIGLRHFDAQLLGGIILHQGKIAEMKTGEGKTLVATLPAYLNALSGKGVHVVTVNDYLAKRDSEWMGPIYRFLGLSVGVIQSQMSSAERKIGYASDITYGTNNEFGFDYLRDNMALSIEECVQQDVNFAIVDEVDSILIDEARTPLIISGMGEDNQAIYKKADTLARRLVKDLDFTVEEKTKNAVLTEQGTKKAEKLLGIEYLFDINNMETAHQLSQSLRAHHLFEKNVDYVIKDDEILIVDEFTGRLMIGRRYSDGLHQAIEAKERVPIKQESQTLATVTFQNYFRMYKKLAGMTGTAKTEEGEFWKIYGLEVVVIPPNRPLHRENLPDVIYKNKRAKFQAVVKEIEASYKTERPVLVGTVSIEHSELLSTMLTRKGIPHHVLNAKQHAREAEIVAKAGQRKAVTISTNMAGRGTDIILGEGVAALGGLYVIGTERHESRRIDNQLRGRSGRQGDPGSSKFYVSLEDDLMRIFGSNRISGIMERLGIEEDTPIEHPLITRAIENAQKKVEEYYFSIRKQVLEYDNVMNKQRETIYALRKKTLKSEALREKVYEMMEQITKDLCQSLLPDKGEWDTKGLIVALKEIVPMAEFDRINEMQKKEEIKEFILYAFRSAYEQKKEHIGEVALKELERVVMLRVLDSKWIEQLHTMDSLREGIGLRAYGQRDPLLDYKIEAYGLFQEMMHSARIEILGLLYKVVLVREGEESPPQAILPKPRITHFSGGGENPSIPIINKEEDKIGRNDLCPCGSGKKYKKCCLNKGK